mmetsp:Transcript_56357/g.167660  ORF Transcript_56357/g.167660 Transcript_56357/m.167660 type:complete len:235 (+) Transcript_56357:1620-2324(+)
MIGACSRLARRQTSTSSTWTSSRSSHHISSTTSRKASSAGHRTSRATVSRCCPVARLSSKASPPASCPGASCGTLAAMPRPGPESHDVCRARSRASSRASWRRPTQRSGRWTAQRARAPAPSPASSATQSRRRRRRASPMERRPFGAPRTAASEVLACARTGTGQGLEALRRARLASPLSLHRPGALPWAGQPKCIFHFLKARGVPVVICHGPVQLRHVHSRLTVKRFCAPRGK